MTEPDRAHHDEYLARYLRTGVAKIIGIGREVTGRRKDGSAIPLVPVDRRVQLNGERYFTGILRDITDRKRWEEHQVLLMAEIDHRAKNLLAAIQAMVLLTKSSARSVDDYADTLIGRLHAMARAHDLLARDKWQRRQALHDLIRDEFAAYVGADSDGGRDRRRGRAAAPAGGADAEPGAARADHQRGEVWRIVGRPEGRVAIVSAIETHARGPHSCAQLDRDRAGRRSCRPTAAASAA